MVGVEEQGLELSRLELLLPAGLERDWPAGGQVRLAWGELWDWPGGCGLEEFVGRPGGWDCQILCQWVRGWAVGGTQRPSSRSLLQIPWVFSACPWDRHLFGGWTEGVWMVLQLVGVVRENGWGS